MADATNPNPYCLPDVPTRSSGSNDMTAALFQRLVEGARKGGWNLVYKIYAEAQTILEKDGHGYWYNRPARRQTLNYFLKNKRPDLKTVIDEAAMERRDFLLATLENEIETIAKGPGDLTQDFDDKGQVKRTRVDTKNKLTAIVKLLNSHDPNLYAERRKVDTTISGQIEHTHQLNDPRGFVLKSETILLLPIEEQQELFTLLEKLDGLQHNEQRELIEIEAEPRALLAAEEKNGGADASGAGGT